MPDWCQNCQPIFYVTSPSKFWVRYWLLHRLESKVQKFKGLKLFHISKVINMDIFWFQLKCPFHCIKYLPKIFPFPTLWHLWIIWVSLLCHSSFSGVSSTYLKNLPLTAHSKFWIYMIAKICIIAFCCHYFSKVTFITWDRCCTFPFPCVSILTILSCTS